MELVSEKKDVKYYCNKLKRAIVFTGWCRRCKDLRDISGKSNSEKI